MGCAALAHPSWQPVLRAGSVCELLQQERVRGLERVVAGNTAEPGLGGLQRDLLHPPLCLQPTEVTPTGTGLCHEATIQAKNEKKKEKKKKDNPPGIGVAAT